MRAARGDERTSEKHATGLGQTGYEGRLTGYTEVISIKTDVVALGVRRLALMSRG